MDELNTSSEELGIPIKTTSSWATASLYSALAAIISLICSFLFIFLRIEPVGGLLIASSIVIAFVAFMFGFIALFVIAAHRKESKGYIRAIAAIFISTPFVLAFLLSMLVARVRAEREKANTGIYNLYLLGEALVEYSKDHDGYLPVADKWCDLLMEYDGNLTRDNFHHPKPDRFQLRGECHFSFNKNLSGMRLSDVPSGTVLLFEADGGWNLNGASELLKTRYEDKFSSIAILLADQTVQRYWYYKEAVRKFDSKGTRMYYEKPRWQP